ncbi:MAG: hypothetical protein ACFFDW_07065 [Candidatus Thorarchaeota archaeon]
MAEVTDLLILAQMSKGSPNEEDAFVLHDSPNDKVIYVIHSLRELVDVLNKITPETLFPSLCRSTDDGFECDIALWIHYVLGDGWLSAKVYNVINEFHDSPEKMKLEVFNLCFNRYLNFQEVLEFSDEFLVIEGTKTSPSDL